jgi:hypothetical protein
MDPKEYGEKFSTTVMNGFVDHVENKLYLNEMMVLSALY